MMTAGAFLFLPVWIVLAGIGAGYDRAIQAATARTVKLYGLGAGQEPGYGSGIVVSPNGQVLTVDSLLIDSTRLRAVGPEGTEYGAAVVWRDPQRQMALLQLAPSDESVRAARDDAGEPVAGARGSLNLPAFTEGDSSHLHAGDWVVAAGNSFNVAEGAEPVSVALGVYGGRARLDARRRQREYPFRGEVLLIDAITSNPGVPGGPLVDAEGRWVGMIGRVVVSHTTHTQFNHAFPVERCLEFLREARDPKLRNQAAADLQAGRENQATAENLGIHLFEMGYRKKLVYVEKVEPASPAERAGLRRDDLIVSAAGRDVPDVKTFRRILGELSPEDALDLIVLRGEEHLRLRVERRAAE